MASKKVAKPVVIKIRDDARPTPLKVPFPLQKTLPSNLPLNSASKTILLVPGRTYSVDPQFKRFIERNASQWLV